jgi:hypothetical protein
MNWSSYNHRWERYEEDYDKTLSVGESITNKFYRIKKMQNGVFTLSWINIKSALVSAIITGVLGIGLYVIGVGDVWKVDFHSLVNIGAISTISAIVSLIKNLLSTNSGKVAGIQVVDN